VRPSACHRVLIFAAAALGVRYGSDALGVVFPSAAGLAQALQWSSPLIVSLAFALAQRATWRRLGWANPFGRHRWAGQLRSLAVVAPLATTQLLLSAALLATAGGVAGNVSCVTGAVGRRLPLILFCGFAEETAWRGYMHGLLGGSGLHKKNISIALIWWAWHINPAHVAAEGEVGRLLWLLPALICSAYVLSWLREASGAIWAAAVAHVSLNVSSGLAARWVVLGSSPLLQAALLCVAIVLAYGGFAVLLWVRFPPERQSESRRS